MKLNFKRQLTSLAMPLVALVIAVILWFYAVGEQSIEVTLSAPLKVDPPPGGRMTVLSSSLQTVTLHLSVPRNVLSVISQDSVRAHHQIKDVDKAGEYNFVLEQRDIVLPPGNVRILSIFPESVTVTLDELIVQKLPIRVPLEGEPAHGYLIDDKKIELNPNAALVEGPKARLEKLEAISTETLDVVGRMRSFRRKVALKLDPDLRSITKDLRVDVFVPIRREYSVIVFHDVSVKIVKDTKTAFAVSVEPELVSFAVNGPKGVLDKITPKDILAFVDATALEKGVHDLPLQLKLPNEVQLNHDTPVIKVKVE